MLIMITAAALLGGCTTDQSPEKQQAAAVGTGESSELKDAPNFTLKTMDNSPFTLSDHKGKVVVLNVWATWCPPCRKEIPDFIEIQKKMRDEGVLFVGVSVDKEGWEVVRPFAKEYGINYPLVVDDGTVRQKYGPLRGIPTTFIINKKGKVEYVAPGMINREALQPALEEIARR
ncbi:cytochrome c biogenesis protein CcmG, thiol:disulfide interchange protein DsbE [Fodinibius sediminis]|uniref:Cytochrome c biogenesis protein CcmG, thiol:disulfide interchange protein DsbE n=2 Tax=Fodinibius sediminis TaxID=1214077 RepID=A0A521B7U6_9BACT|nr:cytochrome c biogenesis protein CcmG, thiol:disulfide interchange protein DsbE [Fodinibius sediminis]